MDIHTKSYALWPVLCQKQVPTIALQLTIKPLIGGPEESQMYLQDAIKETEDYVLMHGGMLYAGNFHLWEDGIDPTASRYGIQSQP